MNKKNIIEKYEALGLRLFFIVLFVFLLVSVIFWTIIPYLQVRTYLSLSEVMTVDKILDTDFLFTPYSYAEEYIRSNISNHIIMMNLSSRDIPLLDSSINKMEEVLEHEPYSIYDYIFLARAYAKRGEISGDMVFQKKAELTFNKAVLLAPKQQEIYFAYGTFLEDLGRYDDSLKVLKYALNLNDSSVLSHYYLGLVEFTTGKSYYIDALKNLEFFFNNSKIFIDNTKVISSPDPVWVKNAYINLLTYFYEKKDVSNLIITAERLETLDNSQEGSYEMLIKTINSTGIIPTINFEK